MTTISNVACGLFLAVHIAWINKITNKSRPVVSFIPQMEKKKKKKEGWNIILFCFCQTDWAPILWSRMEGLQMPAASSSIQQCRTASFPYLLHAGPGQMDHKPRRDNDAELPQGMLLSRSSSSGKVSFAEVATVVHDTQDARLPRCILRGWDRPQQRAANVSGMDSPLRKEMEAGRCLAPPIENLTRQARSAPTIAGWRFKMPSSPSIVLPITSPIYWTAPVPCP